MFKHLGIYEYKDRILKSRSTGELGHLMQYHPIYEYFKKNPDKLEYFKKWFKEVVK